jgi:hypothetical protein
MGSESPIAEDIEMVDTESIYLSIGFRQSVFRGPANIDQDTIVLSTAPHTLHIIGSPGSISSTIASSESGSFVS